MVERDDCGVREKPIRFIAKGPSKMYPLAGSFSPNTQ